MHLYEFVAWVENDIFMRWKKELSQEKNAFAKFGPTCRKSVGKITWIFDQTSYKKSTWIWKSSILAFGRNRIENRKRWRLLIPSYYFEKKFPFHNFLATHRFLYILWCFRCTLGIKVQNMKMDSNTRGQWTLIVQSFSCLV